VSCNAIGELGICALVAALVSPPRLEELHIARNHIRAGGVVAVTTALSQLPRLRTLDMTDCGLYKAPTASVTRLLLAVPHLTALRLNVSASGSGGVLSAAASDAFAESLVGLPQLQTLEIYEDTFIDAGAAAVAHALSALPHLTTLLLPACLCRISDQHLRGLASAVPKLSVLDVSSNLLGRRGAVLTDFLRCFTHLYSLSLRTSQLLDHTVQLVTSAFPSLPLLTSLDLSENSIRDRGATVLARGLHAVPRLTVLRLQNNHITSDGAAALAFELRTNCPAPQLTTLELAGNLLDTSACAALCRAFAHLPRLSGVGVMGYSPAGENDVLVDVMCLLNCPLAWQVEWLRLWACHREDYNRVCLAGWLEEYAWVRRSELIGFRRASVAAYIG
jgi:Ran GTPase-activating protein 1